MLCRIRMGKERANERPIATLCNFSGPRQVDLDGEKEYESKKSGEGEQSCRSDHRGLQFCSPSTYFDDVPFEKHIQLG